MIEVIEADYSLSEHGLAIVQLMDVYARDPMEGGRGLSAQVKENLVAALAERAIARTILAYVESEAVGLINCMEGFSTFACQPLLNIHDVIVLPAYRGRGVAKLMLHKAEAIAREMGCCKLTLEVLEGNRAAQRAYQAVGFSGYCLDPQMGHALFWEKKLT